MPRCGPTSYELQRLLAVVFLVEVVPVFVVPVLIGVRVVDRPLVVIVFLVVIDARRWAMRGERKPFHHRAFEVCESRARNH
jgi:hypothetical protein